MFHVPRVLVQWIPTPDLAFKRSLSLGPKFGAPVQQNGIEWHEDCFPVALAMARRVDDGVHLLQAGFSGPTRVTTEGWIPDGWNVTDPNVQMFQEPLSNAQFVQFVYAQLDADSASAVDRRAKIVTDMVERYKAEQAAALERERAEVLQKPHNNREQFDAVATALKDKDAPAVIRATWPDEA